jgi:hypothetical protein
MTTAQDGGKVVSLTLRPPLPPGNTPGTNYFSVFPYFKTEPNMEALPAAAAMFFSWLAG